MSEQWKQLYDYPNYEISNMGKVRSKQRIFVDSSGRNMGKRERELKLQDNGTGFKYVHISVGSKKKTIYLHKAVAEHFVENENPEEFKYVAHIEPNLDDNSYLNLKWTNRRYITTRYHQNKSKDE